MEPEIRSVKDPVAGPDGVVIEVGACGICRSDWHGWMGNDPDIVLPNVPGHELAGIVVETGSSVSKWHEGDRITVPFVGGCGHCGECRSGNQQVCDRQFQPGFTAWGAFAEFVSIDYADENLVRLPDSMDFVTASSLGCRFVTSYRGVVDQGKVNEGDWVAVFGCGGVGLSAIMIANAFGASVIAVDIDDKKLEFARSIGARHVVNTSRENSVEAIRELSSGGVQISLDAIGSPRVAFDSISSLRKRGKHIQIGLMENGDCDALVPLNMIMAKELEILGSHGMQAHRYPEMIEMIENGQLRPELLVGRKVSLEESIDVLVGMDEFKENGIAVVDPRS